MVVSSLDSATSPRHPDWAPAGQVVYAARARGVSGAGMAQRSGAPVGASAANRPAAPRDAARLAAQRQLGDLRNARVVAGSASILRVAAVVGVVSAVLFWLGNANTAGDMDLFGVIGLIGLAGVLFALVVVAYGAKTALAGSDDWYLYAGGLVVRHRRRLCVVGWREVSALTRKRMGARASSRGSLMTPESLRGYEVHLHDGSQLFLTVSDLLDHGRALAADLEEVAVRAGITVAG